MTALTYIVAGVICALCDIDPEDPEFAPVDEGARGARKGERSSIPAFPRTPVLMESFELLLKLDKSSFLRKQESSPFKTFWIPAFAGMTKWGYFHSSLMIKGERLS
jgi:hypothetical protein